MNAGSSSRLKCYCYALYICLMHFLHARHCLLVFFLRESYNKSLPVKSINFADSSFLSFNSFLGLNKKRKKSQINMNQVGICCFSSLNRTLEDVHTHTHTLAAVNYISNL